MFPPSRWLAVAGCIFSAFHAAPAAFAAGDSFTQPIQYLLKINLLQTVTHQFDGAARKDAEVIIHSRTDLLEISMSGSAAEKRFDETSTQIAMSVVNDPGPLFKIERGACISGLAGERFEKSADDMKFDIGKVCLSLVEKSAEFQLDPSKIKADPDKAILGAYKEVLDSNGMQATFTQAQRLLNTLNDFGSNPQTKGSAGLGFQWSDQPNGKQLYALPSGAIDAGFSEAIQTFQKTGVLPPEPKTNGDALLENARLCYTNAETASLEACKATGKALGAKYLRKTSRVS